MKPEQVKSFTLHIRRLLYLNKIANFTIESLLEIPLPSLIKVDLRNMAGNHNRFLKVIKDKVTKNSQEILNEDLSKDKIHNLNLIMDLLAEDEDADDVVEWLTERQKQKAL